MIFKSKVLLFTTLVIGLICYSIYHFGRITVSDVEEYQQLMSVNNTEVESYQARQEREGVSKQILFTEGAGRVQLLVRSAKSSVHMDHEDEKTDIVEHFSLVKCYMQEELFEVLPTGVEVIKQKDGRYLIRNSDPEILTSWLPANNPNLTPKQVIRYMEATEAKYHYSSDEFVADDVKISRYVLPGHQLTENLVGQKATMSGVAKSVEFSLGDQGINFKAQGFKGTFQPNKRGL